MSSNIFNFVCEVGLYQISNATLDYFDYNAHENDIPSKC